jgi:hypothetical protein
LSSGVVLGVQQADAVLSFGVQQADAAGAFDFFSVVILLFWSTGISKVSVFIGFNVFH